MSLSTNSVIPYFTRQIDVEPIIARARPTQQQKKNDKGKTTRSKGKGKGDPLLQQTRIGEKLDALTKERAGGSMPLFEALRSDFAEKEKAFAQKEKAFTEAFAQKEKALAEREKVLAAKESDWAKEVYSRFIALDAALDERRTQLSRRMTQANTVNINEPRPLSPTESLLQ